jgi:hypothetical protein
MNRPPDYRCPSCSGAVASLAMAIGAGFAFALWTRRTARRHAADQALLAAVSSLDLEDPRGWQAPVLVADANLAALTERLLGTYRLQQAKLTRYVCLEGELHRLGKALACAAREDLEGQWDNVAVGTAADEALHVFDRLAAAEAELAAARKQIADNGPDLVAQLAEARGWTTTAVEQVNAQGAAIERLVVKLGRLAEAPGADEARSKTRQEQVIAAIRQDLAEIPARGGRPHAEALGADLTRLVDRASKLAFQIAMEVARLAGKNERPAADDPGSRGADHRVARHRRRRWRGRIARPHLARPGEHPWPGRRTGVGHRRAWRRPDA